MNHKIYAIIGPSGSGKTTLGINAFGKDKEIVSTTTRKMRKGEKQGVDYNFVTQEEFRELNESNALAEIAKYSNQYYGITKTEINKKTENGLCYVVVEMDGFTQLMRAYPRRVVPIFIQVDKEVAKERLIKRGDDPELVKRRQMMFDFDAGHIKLLNIIGETIVIDGNQSIEKMVQSLKKQLK